ncbi:MAG: type II toxin-antitoxin system HipA family toxin [Bacteroidota bacterium]
MIKYIPLRTLKVSLDFGEEKIPVGRLAIRDGKIYFEYDASILGSVWSISPLKLPLEPGLKTFDPFLFEGLPGVFNDSLPDGWGRLLLDRWLRGKDILPQEVSPLDRLAYVGATGLGALIYEPDHSERPDDDVIDLNELAAQTRRVLDGEARDVLGALIALNGSSAGARPKALIGVDQKKQKIVYGTRELSEGFDRWIVKFPNTRDGEDAGAVEYVYSLLAKAAGIHLPDTHLFPANVGPGYFATKRFDRVKNSHLHMHSVSGLLHSDFRSPSLDYETLLNLSAALTGDIREVEKMFRLAAFNVLSHNRDDHGKNFSFLMDASGLWTLSPAYDLTFSSGPNGEQSTMVMGEGRNPSIADLRRLGAEAPVSEQEVNQIIEQVRDALQLWPNLASEYGVSKGSIELVSKRLAVLASD